MSLNDTPMGSRVHIAFFGCRNAGKSSLVNAFTGQVLSIVSEQPGTTTDPVKKSMELLPMGPVVIIDTPGADDEGALGEQRVERALRVLDQSDIAVLCADATRGLLEMDHRLLAGIRERGIPCVIAWTKSDLLSDEEILQKKGVAGQAQIFVSALTGKNLEALKNMVARLVGEMPQENRLVSDLVSSGELLVLVVPIDKAAPKGRLILPQQMVIRDALEVGAIPVVCRESELAGTLDKLKKPPCLVITDSQVFRQVAETVPEEIALTSFSILMARYKGNLIPSVEGAARLSALSGEDRILIAEGCTHHRQCGDIGSVKLPALIRRFTGSTLKITLCSGTEFPRDLSPYKLVIHCGACMLNPAEAQSRYRIAGEQGVPITNYGIAIAHMNGILSRSLQPLGIGWT